MTFKLVNIDLSVMKIRYLPEKTFSACPHLRYINLSFNPLVKLPADMFSQSNDYYHIDLRGIPLQSMDSTNVFSITHIRVITGELPELCCISKFVDQCLVKQTGISSCEHLISPLLLQVTIWINGITVIALNLAVVYYRLSTKKSRKKWSAYTNVYIINTACADVMMGVYVIILAVTNTSYRGIYAAFSWSWRTSNMCRILSVMSTVSFEVSLLSLATSVWFQFFTIQHVYGTLRHIKLLVTMSLATIWVIVAILGIIPVIDLPYFGRKFMSKSGTCLLYHLTSEGNTSKEYTIAIWLLGNLIILLMMSALQFGLGVKIYRSRSKVGGRRSAQAVNSYYLLVFYALVAVLCWMPVLITLMLVNVGVYVSEITSEYIVVLMLPLNALVNPILYTARTISFKATN